MYAYGSFVHQKCSNYALTNLLFGLCRSVWIIDLLFICPSPHPGTSMHPSTLEMLQAKECVPIPFSSIVFTFGITFESFKECGGASHSLHLSNFFHFPQQYLFWNLQLHRQWMVIHHGQFWCYVLLSSTPFYKTFHGLSFCYPWELDLLF